MQLCNAFLHVWTRQTLKSVELKRSILRQRGAVDLEAGYELGCFPFRHIPSPLGII